MAPAHKRGRRVFTPGIGQEVPGNYTEAVDADVLEKALPGTTETDVERLQRLAQGMIEVFQPELDQ